VSEDRKETEGLSLNKRALQKAKQKLLRQGREKAGLPSFTKKGTVFIVAARDLGVSPPVTSARGYELLAQWLGWSTAWGPPRPPKVQRQPKQPKAVSAPKSTLPFAVSHEFLLSYEWRKLRMEVIKERGARCECCGSTPKDGIRINVDHIKPRRKFPHLALAKTNLQVLCEDCNHGKGNWDETDWREPVDPMAPRLVKAAG
jgi:hypothetical protein